MLPSFFPNLQHLSYGLLCQKRLIARHEQAGIRIVLIVRLIQIARFVQIALHITANQTIRSAPVSRCHRTQPCANCIAAQRAVVPHAGNLQVPAQGFHRRPAGHDHHLTEFFCGEGLQNQRQYGHPTERCKKLAAPLRAESLSLARSHDDACNLRVLLAHLHHLRSLPLLHASIAIKTLFPILLDLSEIVKQFCR